MEGKHQLTKTTRKSDAEIALLSARAELAKLTLHTEQMRNALIADAHALATLGNSLETIDKLSLHEGADDSTLYKDAAKAGRLIERAVEQLSSISSCLGHLECEISERNFGPIPHLGLAAASLSF
jgi:hypothetical protein